MRLSFATAVLAAGVLCSAAKGTAESVQLVSRGGGIEISGELLGFDGEFYRVDSRYGVVTLDALRVDCIGAACPDPETFVPEIMISGAAETAGWLWPPLVEAFALSEGFGFVREDEDPSHYVYSLLLPEEERTVARLRVRLTTSREGFADLVAEQADFTLAMRSATPGERALAQDAGLGELNPGGQGFRIALDGLVAIVQPENVVRSLSSEELGKILRGEVRNWLDLGGQEGPIAVHLPGWTGDVDRIIGVRFGSVPVQVNRHETPAILAAVVASTKGALGLTFASATGPARALSVQGSCGVGTELNESALKNGDYPLSLSHYVYVPERRQAGIARRFRAFLASPEAQNVVAQSGYAARDLSLEPLREQGTRLLNAIAGMGSDVTAGDLRDVVDVLGGASRVSVTFRFSSGEKDSEILDEVSADGVGLLADAIRDGVFDGGQIILAGFTDGVGDRRANQSISRARAELVREALREELGSDNVDRISVDIHGFGEAMPLACDDEQGAPINRRVETWFVQK